MNADKQDRARHLVWDEANTIQLGPGILKHRYILEA